MKRLCISAVIVLSALGLAAQGTPHKKDHRTLRPQQAQVLSVGQEARVALVIGNGAYKDSPLKNPPNDARAVAAALKELGFKVDLVLDGGRKRMLEAVRLFGQKLTEGGIGLFYYAGHGMQVKGANYLIPVGADIATEEDVTTEALDANTVLARMDSAKNRVNLVILDACRNNPFARSFRSASGGLAQMEAPSGTFVAFATAPGSTASDGDGRNGLYTQHLLRAMKEPGLKVEEVFKQVRVGVKRASHDAQVPWDSSSLTGEFYFRGGGSAPAPAPIVLRPLSAEQPGEEAYQQGMACLFGRGVLKNDQEALIHLIEAADQGHAEAQARLGRMYMHGMGTPANPVKALEYSRKAADQGNARGLVGLGDAYAGRIPGCGLEKDEKKAFECYDRAAALGLWLGLLDLGEMHREGKATVKDEGRALVLFRRTLALLRPLAEEGDAEAQGSMGAIYKAGLGVDKNDDEAVVWFRKSAEQGWPFGQFNLGLMYLNGQGVPKSEAEAFSWFRKAADLGSSWAQHAMGYLFQNGKGVAQSDAEALAWYLKSAGQGNSVAQVKLGHMYLNGKGVAQSDAAAVTWFRKAAEQGNGEAYDGLGILYLRGKAVTQSDAEAIAWYRKSASLGLSQGQYNLGWMYQAGRGVAKDEAEAVAWFRKSAEQGHNQAENWLGVMHQGGRGVAQSDAEAVIWYRKAAEHGEPYAQHNLGTMYRYGKGVPKDLVQASEWFKKAADQGNEGAKKALAELR
jgi:TPR repeat protein